MFPSSPPLPQIRTFLAAILILSGALASHAADPITVALVLDHSGSMSTQDPNDYRISASKLLLDLMDSGSDAAAVIGFGSDVKVQQPLTTSLTNARNAVSKYSGGGTNYAPALEAGKLQLDSSSASTGRRAIVFFSDGAPSDSYSTELSDIASAGYRIYAIGFGGASNAVMNELASDTGGKAYNVTADTLQITMLDVISKIRGVITPILEEETISQGDTVSNTVNISCGVVYESVTFTAIWASGSTIELSAQSPSGVPYTGTTSGSNAILTVDNPECGNWTLTLKGTSISGGSINVSYGAVQDVAATGWIRVSTNPSGGQVRRDGTTTWRSSGYTFKDLTPGTYKFWGQKSGYNTTSSTKSVGAGQQVSKTLYLSRQTGSISASGQPGSLQVSTDNSNWYDAPHTFSSISTGQRTVYARATGFYSENKQVTVSSSSTVPVSFDLTPVGAIDISLPGDPEVLAPGESQTVNWISTGLSGNVKVELLQDGSVVETLVSSVPIANGTYLWALPSNQQTGRNFVLRVTSTESSTVYGQSQAFAIGLRELKIGALTLEADLIAETAADSGIWRAEGNARLEDLVYADGYIEADLNSIVISGSTRLWMPAQGILPETTLWDGDFDFAITDLKLELTDLDDAKASKLALSQFPLAIGTIEFRDRSGVIGLEVTGILDLHRVKVDLGTEGKFVRIDRNGVSIDGEIIVEDFSVSTWGFRDTKITFQRDAGAGTSFFAGETVVDLPAKFDVEARVEFLNGSLKLIGMGVDFNDPGLVIVREPQTLLPIVYLQRIYGEVDNIATPDPWVLRLGEINDAGELTSGVTMTLGPQINDHFALKGSLAAEISSAGRFWGAGEIFLISDDYRFSRADLVIDLKEGVYASIEFNWSLIDTDWAGAGAFAQGELSIDKFNTLRAGLNGSMHVRFGTEDGWLSIEKDIVGQGFLKIAKPDGDELPDAYIIFAAQLGAVELSAHYDFLEEDLVFPSNTELIESVSIMQLSSARTLSGAEKTIQTIEITRAGDYLFALGATGSIDALTLVSPSGQRYEAGTPEVGLIREDGDGALLTKRIPANELGDWTLVGSDTLAATVDGFEIHRVKDLPQVDEPAVESLGSNRYRISWNDYDPATGRTTVLYGKGSDLGTAMAIGEFASSDSNNSVIWDASDLPSGTYTILVSLEQPEQFPAIAQAPVTVQILAPTAPTAPRNVELIASDGILSAGWDAVSGAVGYDVELRDLQDSEAAPLRFAHEGSSTVDMAGLNLSPGHDYQFRIRAYNASAERSDWAGWHTTQLTPATGTNTAPVIENLHPAATIGQLYDYSVQGNDPQGDSFTYNLLDGPEGFTLTNDGSSEWTPTTAQAGWQTVTIEVEDSVGASSKRDLKILVYHASAPRQLATEPVYIEGAGDITVETWGEPFAQDFHYGSHQGGRVELTVENLPGGVIFTDRGNGTARLEWTPPQSAIGTHGPVTLTAKRGTYETTSIFNIIVKDLSAQITYPAGEQRIKGTIDILGTCYAEDDFAGGVLEIRPEDGTEEDYTNLAFYSSVIESSELLAGFDSTAYSDGGYVLRLKAQDREGSYLEREVFFVIDNTPPQVQEPLVISNGQGNIHWTPEGGDVVYSVTTNEGNSLSDWRLLDDSLNELTWSGAAPTEIPSRNSLNGQFTASNSNFVYEVKLSDSAGNQTGWIRSNRIVTDSSVDGPYVTSLSSDANLHLGLGDKLTLKGFVADPFQSVKTVKWSSTSDPATFTSDGVLMKEYTRQGLRWELETDVFFNNEIYLMTEDQFGNSPTESTLFKFSSIQSAPKVNLTAPENYTRLESEGEAIDIIGTVQNAENRSDYSWKLDYAEGLNGAYQTIKSGQTTEVVNGILGSHTVAPGTLYRFRLTATNSYGTEETTTKIDVVAPGSIDSDQDGLSDSFEWDLISSDPNDSFFHILDIEPRGDFDSDGVPNYVEARLGTDATDSASNPLLNEDAALAGGWAQSDWFGLYNVQFYPYVYHFEHGWLYMGEAENDHLYYYDYGLERKVYTDSGSYPELYLFDDNKPQWIHFYEGLGDAPESRRFYVREANAPLSTSQLVQALESGLPLYLQKILAGTFQMGDSQGIGNADERPVHEVTVSDFYLSRTELTWEQLREIMQWAYDQGKIEITGSTIRNLEGDKQILVDLDHDASKLSFPADTFSVESAYPRHPIVGLSWYGAAAICNYLGEMQGVTASYDLATWSCSFSKGGYRLPTEAEWEYAARGGLTQKTYPNGNKLTPTEANFDSAAPVQVATYEPNGFGLYDLTGNVWEFANDWYAADSYTSDSVSNPRGPDNGTEKAIRGGNYSNDATGLRNARRASRNTSQRSEHQGIRLAYAPPPPPPIPLVSIPSGTFQMGDSKNEGSSNERPVHSVTISKAFEMSETEVTNEQLALAYQWAYDSGHLTATSSTAQAGGQELLDLDDSDCRITFSSGSFTADSGYEDHPAVEVTWYGAVAYGHFLSLQSGLESCYDLSDWSCNFSKSGYRLPTEAEWEYAARGGLDGKSYPWGDESPSGRANYISGGTAAVKSYPSSENAYGLYDMSGNVLEWCWDWYSSSYYGSSPSTDPVGPSSGSLRVLRGGGWFNDASSLRCAYRSYDGPSNGYYAYGFRVLRSSE